MNNLSVTLLAAAFAAFGFTSCVADTGVPKDYPLKTCPISGEKLGEHGKPVKMNYEGTDIWLCCGGCKKDFNKEPAKFAQAVKDAQKK